MPFVLVADRLKGGLLVVTPLAVNAVEDHEHEKRGFYGLKVEYSRKGPHVNSPMTADVVGYSDPGRIYTTARVESVVRAVMGVKPWESPLIVS